MSLLEFPDLFSQAVEKIGGFFYAIHTFFINVGFLIQFVALIVVFFGLQILFIYVYYKLFMFALGLAPRVQQMIKRIDRFFAW